MESRVPPRYIPFDVSKKIDLLPFELDLLPFLYPMANSLKGSLRLALQQGSLYSWAAGKKSSRKPISKILHSPGPIGQELPGLAPNRYRVLPKDVVMLDGYAGLRAPWSIGLGP